LREWRELRSYTLEDACDRLLTTFEAELTPGTLSRMERGESALDTGWMAMLAEVYDCGIADLVARPPYAGHGLHEIVNQIPAEHHEQAAAILRTFVPKAS
jgi:transcriptional regulator with XRE-family HTH domain